MELNDIFPIPCRWRHVVATPTLLSLLAFHLGFLLRYT
jgi:hypothetical protein